MAAPKILLIEDNPSDVYILRIALEELEENFVLEVLIDGEEAIRFIESQRHSGAEAQPCVIVLDLHIPKHDGLEVLRLIRQKPHLDHVEVVLLTTAASPREEAELRRLGADYRYKPVGLAGYSELAKDLIAICKGLSVSV